MVVVRGDQPQLLLVGMAAVEQERDIRVNIRAHRIRPGGTKGQQDRLVLELEVVPSSKLSELCDVGAHQAQFLELGLDRLHHGNLAGVDDDQVERARQIRRHREVRLRDLRVDGGVSPHHGVGLRLG